MDLNIYIQSSLPYSQNSHHLCVYIYCLYIVLDTWTYSHFQKIHHYMMDMFHLHDHMYYPHSLRSTELSTLAHKILHHK